MRWHSLKLNLESVTRFSQWKSNVLAFANSILKSDADAFDVWPEWNLCAEFGRYVHNSMNDQLELMTDAHTHIHLRDTEIKWKFVIEIGWLSSGKSHLIQPLTHFVFAGYYEHSAEIDFQTGFVRSEKLIRDLHLCNAFQWLHFEFQSNSDKFNYRMGDWNNALSWVIWL